MTRGFLKTLVTIVIFGGFFLGGCGTQRRNEEQAVAIQLEPQTAAETETAEASAAETQEPPAAVYVHICGAVNAPGVYAVEADSRLFAVVALAGGLTPEADEASLNLAHTVTDGQQIIVLTKQETADLAAKGLYGAGMPEAAQGSGNGLVNINTASVAELTAISGIGESRAQAIIAYRERNGGFRTIEDIKKVDGIKDGLFSKIKDKITV